MNFAEKNTKGFDRSPVLLAFGFCIAAQICAFLSLPVFTVFAAAKLSPSKIFSIEHPIVLSAAPLIRIDKGQIEFSTSKPKQKSSPDDDTHISTKDALPAQWFDLVHADKITSISLAGARITIDTRGKAGGVDPQRVVRLILKKSNLQHLLIKNSRIVYRGDDLKSETLLIERGLFDVDLGDGEISGDGLFILSGIGGQFKFSAEADGNDKQGNEQSKIDLNFKTDYFKGEFSGSVGGEGRLHVNGDVDFQMVDPRNLIQGELVAAGTDHSDRLQVKGRLDLTPAGGSLTLNRLKFLDNIASGSLSFKHEGTLPQIAGTLAFAQLDLGSISQIPHSDERGAESSSRSRKSTTDHPHFSEPLLAFFATWSGFIKEWEADIRISAEKARFGNLDLNDAAFSVYQQKGIAIFEMAESQVFDGLAMGHIKLDANFPKPRWHINAALSQVEMEKFWHIFLGQKPLQGPGHFRLHLTSFGDQRDELYKNMFGNVELLMPDGGKIGLDLKRLADPLAEAGGDDKIALQKKMTPFKTLQGKGQFSKGVIVGDHFIVSTDAHDFTGRGVTDLRRGLLNWQIASKLQGDKQEQGLSEIPINSCFEIVGPFDAILLKKAPMIKNGDAGGSLRDLSSCHSQSWLQKQKNRLLSMSENAG